MSFLGVIDKQILSYTGEGESLQADRPDLVCV